MSISAAFIVPHPPLIVPEIGKGAETAVQTTINSYHAVARAVAELAPQTIVVITPHSLLFADYIHVSPGAKASGSLEQFGAPQRYDVTYDTQLAEMIRCICARDDFPAGPLGEGGQLLDHGTLVPLHFINQYYTDYRLLRCSVSGLSRMEHYRFGIILSQAIKMQQRNAVIIASGDLSHRLSEDGPYGFAPEGPRLDACLTDIMRSGDFGSFFRLDDNLCQRGAECGLKAFIIMSGALDGMAVEPRFYSYEGVTGVGYALCSFTVKGPAPGRDFLVQEQAENKRRIDALRGQEDAYVGLARSALEGYLVKGQLPPMPEDMPDELRQQRAGVFVSLKKHGELRGCIGTTEPTTGSIAQEIRQNALSAGLRDPRFVPVTEDELPELVYSVDVLSPAEPCEKRDLDAQAYGVIVSSGRKRGLLLPDLAGVDTVEQQIEIACRKAGIEEHEQYTLERFQVIRHK